MAPLHHGHGPTTLYHGVMRLQLLLASVALVGCGGMVAEVEDGGRDAATDGAADAAAPRGTFFVHEVSPATGTLDIVVSSDCDVTKNGTALGRASATACAEFWRAVYDVAAGTAGPCPPTDGTTYSLELDSSLGPTYRKTEKDYCLRSLPGIAAHKGAYGLVYALGGK